MPLTNAQKQRRWKERNQIVLTWDADAIAEKLMDMEDQQKLAKVVTFLKDHLKHPDRNSEERSIALGRSVTMGFNGPLTKRQALEALRAPASPPQSHSFRVEATTKDGRRWYNGVRLHTEEEAQTYIEWYARSELQKEGYLTAEVLRCDGEPPVNFITRSRAKGRPTLGFPDGTCGSLEWTPTAAQKKPVASTSTSKLTWEEVGGRILTARCRNGECTYEIHPGYKDVNGKPTATGHYRLYFDWPGHQPMKPLGGLVRNATPADLEALKAVAQKHHDGVADPVINDPEEDKKARAKSKAAYRKRKAKRERKRKAKDRPYLKEFAAQVEALERATAAGEIPKGDYDAWMDHRPVSKATTKLLAGVKA